MKQKVPDAGLSPHPFELHPIPSTNTAGSAVQNDSLNMEPITTSHSRPTISSGPWISTSSADGAVPGPRNDLGYEGSSQRGQQQVSILSGGDNIPDDDLRHKEFILQGYEKRLNEACRDYRFSEAARHASKIIDLSHEISPMRPFTLGEQVRRHRTLVNLYLKFRRAEKPDGPTENNTVPDVMSQKHSNVDYEAETSSGSDGAST